MNRYLLLSVILLLGMGIVYGFMTTVDHERKSIVITKQLLEDLSAVRNIRILFSHHSVGANIIAGIQHLDSEISGESHIRLASLEEAAISKGPMLIHFSGGQNGEPITKIDSFAYVIRNEKLLKPDFAFMKLCFVDFDPRTNVDGLFDHYRNTFEALKREYPKIKFVHFTVPLTQWPTELKWRIFRFIGKEVWEDSANVKRDEFNRKLKEVFRSDPIFDLARLESTAPDGSLTTFDQEGKSYPSLYPGYTEDGGHLNILGQQVVGAGLVQFISEVISRYGRALN